MTSMSTNGNTYVYGYIFRNFFHNQNFISFLYIYFQLVPADKNNRNTLERRKLLALQFVITK